MNDKQMKQNVQTPAFTKAASPSCTDQQGAVKKNRTCRVKSLPRILLLSAILAAAAWLLSRVLTAEVITVLTVTAVFLLLRILLKFVLHAVLTMIKWILLLAAVLVLILFIL